MRWTPLSLLHPARRTGGPRPWSWHQRRAEVDRRIACGEPVIEIHDGKVVSLSGPSRTTPRHPREAA
jgi:hypothetical protein